MAVITLETLPHELLHALQRRAADNGRSTEAEIRHILEEVLLEEALHPRSRPKIGSELAALGHRFGGLDIDTGRDSDSARPAIFD